MLTPCSDDPVGLILRELREVKSRLAALEEVLRANRKDLLTICELASLVGRSEYTCRRWVAEGKIPAVRLTEGGPRGRLLVPREAVDRLIAAGLGGDVPAVALPCGSKKGGAIE